MTCEQCEAQEAFAGTTKAELRANLAAAGWEPYGTGVTPLAEESGERGMFSCPRCSNELQDQRLHRLGADVVHDLGLADSWLVVRTGDSPNDYFRVLRRDAPVQVAFEHFKTDREIAITAALGM